MKDPRIERAMGLCKTLVGCFSYSWRRKKELSEAQKTTLFTRPQAQDEVFDKVGL